jgi:hypothetical protein
MTGELKERWIFPDDSRVWNAFGGITTVLDNGDLLIGACSPSKGRLSEISNNCREGIQLQVIHRTNEKQS